MSLDVETTTLPGVLRLRAQRFGDDRGFFEESWNATRFAEQGVTVPFVQDNHSYSAEAGTLRGLHFQAPPQAQHKLVRCTRGAIFDVAVDIRVGSPTYGQWCASELSRENGAQLFIPKGFLHGFVTLVADTEVQYKCSANYAPECDGSVLWSSLPIPWPLPLGRGPVLSKKDEAAEPFEAFSSPFRWDP